MRLSQTAKPVQRLRDRLHRDAVPGVTFALRLAPVAAAGLTVAGLAYIGLVWLGIAPYAPPVTADYGPMGDSRGYWDAWENGLYDIPWLTHGAFVYSPAFAQATWPLTLLPWPVWAITWTAASIAILFWLRVPYLLAFPPVLDDILRGNVHVFMAAAIVIGMRYPVAWSFLLLTKVTPGIGLLWFAARYEWGKLSMAILGTLGIALASYLIGPHLWEQWLQLLTTNAGTTSGVQVIPLPLTVRLAISAGLTVYGARAGRAWLVPVGVAIAMPNVWPSTLAVLAASIPLARRDR